MQESTPRNIGIIGCGHVVQRWHLPALCRVKGLQVTAVADTDKERLQLVADGWGVPRRFTESSELVKSRDVDAVAVCVPAAFHAPVAVDALEAGKDVFIEKPLALSLEDCDRILAAAERSGRVVMVGFNLRWHRLIRAVRKLLARDRFGRLRSIRSVFTCGQDHEDGQFAWRKRRVHGGGTLIEMAVHHFDLWRMLGAGEIEDVHAVARSNRSDDDASVVTARLSSGILASGVFGEGTGGQNALELFGERGRTEIELTRVDGLRLTDIAALPGDPKTHLQRLGHTFGSLINVLRRWPVTSDWERSFIEMWRHFHSCLIRVSEVGCTALEGRLAVEIALAAAASATEDRPVRVAEAPGAITPPAEAPAEPEAGRGSNR